MTGSLDYPALIDTAMRSVVKEALTRIKQGLPGDHHFYITYDTQAAGVRMSEQLRSRYPKTITIVLQHQFWDLKIEDVAFHVTLSFAGVPEKLTVPYSAMLAFADPAARITLQFHPREDARNEESALPVFEDAELTDETPAVAEIISLDSFRKK